MGNIHGFWCFSERYKGDINKPYPEIKKSLRILMENLISSKILLPNSLYGKIPLQYNTVDELMDQIEASGYLKTTFEFDIEGDTIMYTSDGEETYPNIISIIGFGTIEPSFSFAIRTNHWLPMLDKGICDFIWNLDRYQRNYHRIPTLLKKLHDELGWQNENLLTKDSEFITVQAGYDYFLEESVISIEYEDNPHPDFDLDEYLAAIKTAREK